jgi:hypothetical protein
MITYNGILYDDRDLFIEVIKDLPIETKEALLNEFDGINNNDNIIIIQS